MDFKTIEQQLLYICSKMEEYGYKLNKTKVFKLFWFANLEMADRYAKLMTQDVFLKKNYGPVPVKVEEFVNDLVDRDINKHLHGQGPIKVNDDVIGYDDLGYPIHEISFIATGDLEEDYLSEVDKEVMDTVVSKYGERSARNLSDMTHIDGGAWSRANKNKVIDITLDMNNKKFIPLVEDTYSNFRDIFILSLY